MATPHGKVRIKKPGSDKARTVSAALWSLEYNPFKRQGYVIVGDAPAPVGVSAKPPAVKPAKKEKVKVEQVDEADEQPETNVDEE